MANRVVKFLRLIGGGTKDLDDPKVSQSTRNWYTVLGALMLIVATLSACVAGFTWASVMHAVGVGVGVAVMWWFFSLSLNYMMAAIIDAVRGRRGAFAIIFGAVLLFGVLISAVNSNFIMLYMLDTEIRQTIQADYQAERSAKEQELARKDSTYAQELGRLRLTASAAEQRLLSEGNAQIAVRQAEVDKLTADFRAATTAVTTEVDGRGQSRQVGAGARARQKQQEADTVKALLDQATARLAQEKAQVAPAVAARVSALKQTLANDEARLSDRLQEDKAKLQRDIKEMDLVPRDGFINRDLAMWRLVEKDPHFLFIFMALFFLIECIVALVKVLMGKTDYHFLRESLAIDTLNQLGEKIKVGQEADRQRALDKVAAEYALRDTVRQARLDDERKELEAAAQRTRMVNDHLAALAAGGMTEEAVEAERARLTKPSKFRMIVGGKR